MFFFSVYTDITLPLYPIKLLTPLHATSSKNNFSFCFGQTASGKTFTLFGHCGTGEDLVRAEGLYVIAARRIFDTVEELMNEGFDMAVGVSMFEIYGQKVFDLLDDHKSLQALEDGNGVLQLVGLSRHRCADFNQFIDITDGGRAARSTTATGANATSSRSHCVMAISLLDESDGMGEQVTFTPKNAADVVGKLSLIDLAGSERGIDNCDTDKTTRMEGRQINTSLLALKEVIRALDGKSSRAPFRSSRLTQVLQESLTGDMCQTVVVACISATLENCQQTLNTLRYAEGLKRSKATGNGNSSKFSDIKGNKKKEKLVISYSPPSQVSPEIVTTPVSAARQQQARRRWKATLSSSKKKHRRSKSSPARDRQGRDNTRERK